MIGSELDSTIKGVSPRDSSKPTEQNEDILKGHVPAVPPCDSVDEKATAISTEDCNTATPVDSSAVTQPEARDQLRRSSSKVMNLRAVFERQQGGDGKPSPSNNIVRQSEPSPVRSYGPDMEVVKLKGQVEVVNKQCDQQREDIAALEQHLKRESALRHRHEEESIASQAEIESLKARLAEKDREYLIQAERVDQMMSTMRMQAQEEVETAQQQILELKKSIAEGTRVKSLVSDATFAEEMQKLHHEVQNWVLSQYRTAVKTLRSAVEMQANLEIIEEPKFRDLKDIFEPRDPASRLAALQTIVVSYLMEIFSEPLLFGLTGQSDWRKHLKRVAETLPSVLPPLAYNKWRSHTLELIGQTNTISASIESASESMSEMICITLNTLTGSEESRPRIKSLNAITKRAISLSHLFRMQPSGYEFFLPPPGSHFLPVSMEEISGEKDNDAVVTRIIRCATFPSVLKHGEGQCDSANVIIKAKVLCIS